MTRSPEITGKDLTRISSQWYARVRMTGFVKIYGTKLLDSTLWLECWQARLVFLGMLAIAGADGIVDIPSRRVLARRLNLPQGDVDDGLDVLEAPDPDSRSPAEEGRRLLRLETGWQVVNYEKYREYRSERQEKARLRAADWRRKHGDEVRTNNESTHDVTRERTEAEAEANSEADAELTPQPPRGKRGARLHPEVDDAIGLLNDARHAAAQGRGRQVKDRSGQALRKAVSARLTGSGGLDAVRTVLAWWTWEIREFDAKRRTWDPAEHLLGGTAVFREENFEKRAARGEPASPSGPRVQQDLQARMREADEKLGRQYADQERSGAGGPVAVGDMMNRGEG